MKKKIWVNKINSFSKAQDFDDSYYLSLTPREKLEMVQFLREEYRKLKRDAKPRYTKDLDILGEPSKGNARKILRVLEELGFGEFSVSVEDLTGKGNILQLG